MRRLLPRPGAAVACLAGMASLSGLLSGCTGPAKAQKPNLGSGKIAVLLPDTASSTRWESDDRRYLTAAFKAEGLSDGDFTIDNAQGDPSNQQGQAEQAITNGASVLLLVNLDSGSGAAIEANAVRQGLKVIDYDRLTLRGSASYYVSFDNVRVGKLQGQGLVDCLAAKKPSVAKPSVIQLDGSPDDNNSAEFKQGYDSVLDPLFASGAYVRAGEQSVPKWDIQQATTIFDQMLTRAGNTVDGVAAANDALANAAITVLGNRGLHGVPVTGQDATIAGLQNILAGDQCMTVYKPVQQEAIAAARLALELREGKQPTESTTPVSAGDHDVPSVLLTPVPVTMGNIKQTVIRDGFRTLDQICTGRYLAMCKADGLT
ncbi:MAG: D-xylose transport system substrate-binding protein [Frankiales bacterium]|nr:D-xylose transport system substrate-binding protein [Frankiales bacterium]